MKKEHRITSVIGVYGCLIMSNTSEDPFDALWCVLGVFWTLRYIYFTLK